MTSGDRPQGAALADDGPHHLFADAMPRIAAAFVAAQNAENALRESLDELRDAIAAAFDAAPAQIVDQGASDLVESIPENARFACQYCHDILSVRACYLGEVHRVNDGPTRHAIHHVELLDDGYIVYFSVNEGEPSVQFVAGARASA